MPRCLIYSGHDTTIAPLLASLHSTHALMSPTHTAPGWPTFAGNMMLELLEEVPSQSSTPGPAPHVPAHLALEDSLAPLPPTATEDDEHTLPPQAAAEANKAAAEPETTAAAKSAAAPAAAGVSSTPAAPRSRWFLRLLVDHKEVSLLPYDAYRPLREAYKVTDWLAECKQKTDAKLPAHQW